MDNPQFDPMPGAGVAESSRVSAISYGNGMTVAPDYLQDDQGERHDFRAVIEQLVNTTSRASGVIALVSVLTFAAYQLI